MGFFSNLDTEPYDRQYEDRELIRRIALYFNPHKTRLTIIILYLMIIAGFGAGVPILVSRSVDLLQENITLNQILWISGAVLSAGIIIWGANWIRRKQTARTIGDVVLQIRLDAFRAAASHDLSFYDQHSSGRIVSRITSDSREFGQMVTLITDLISQILEAILLGIALSFIQIQLLGYLILFLPVIFGVAVGFRALARRATRRGMRAMGNVNAAIKETVSGIGIAKNFRQEKTIFNEFNEANTSSFKVNLERGFILSLVFPTLNVLAGIGTAILLYVGGVKAADAAISAGAWYLFLESLNRFWFPVLNLSAFWAQVQSGLSAAERAFALIDAEPAVTQKNNLSFMDLKGEIKFDKICFHYTEGEQILKDFDLHIQPGENIALVGHTGSGKTSLARLAARFYEFQGGILTVDRNDIRDFDLTTYRRQLGIVSQSPFLFSETVAENIRYAKPGIKNNDIEKLARKIGEGDWLETLPDGLETEVGERGSRLSMGQRQLVSLMRVLVQNPTIFILDEATASIDPFTEWQIQQALKLILANTTSIMIAHRLSTVKAADRILVLEYGRIIEEGNHTSLLAQDGQYASLYNAYFRHQSLAYVEQAPRLTNID